MDIMYIYCGAATICQLQWHHNERDGVSNHRRFDCLLNRLFSRRPKKTSKLRVTGLCEGNSRLTGEFPTQRASNAENVSIWWRYHLMREAFFGTWVGLLYWDPFIIVKSQQLSSRFHLRIPDLQVVTGTFRFTAAYMRHWIGTAFVQITAWHQTII